jgi:hypothetical protein
VTPSSSASLSAIKVYRGVSIYQVRGSQYWYVRVWDRERKQYVVKTTGATSAIKAREVAKDYALSLLKAEKVVEREFAFKYFAIKLLSKSLSQVDKGERNLGYVKSMQWAVQNEDWGLIRKLGGKDVRQITTRDFRDYMEALTEKRPDLSSSTKNTIMAAFRNVMKMALEEGAIDTVPDTPRSKQKDNPRPFFRFYPLVSKEEDVYERLLGTAREMAANRVVIRGIAVTDELCDLILFLTHSFVRPIISELYAIRTATSRSQTTRDALSSLSVMGRLDFDQPTPWAALCPSTSVFANAIPTRRATTISSFHNAKIDRLPRKTFNGSSRS